MNRLIDLHTHTNASDGSLSPSEFVLYCKEKNIKSGYLFPGTNNKEITQGAVLCVMCAIGAETLAKVGIRYFSK